MRPAPSRTPARIAAIEAPRHRLYTTALRPAIQHRPRGGAQAVTQTAAQQSTAAPPAHTGTRAWLWSLLQSPLSGDWWCTGKAIPMPRDEGSRGKNAHALVGSIEGHAPGGPAHPRSRCMLPWLCGTSKLAGCKKSHKKVDAAHIKTTHDPLPMRQAAHLSGTPAIATTVATLVSADTRAVATSLVCVRPFRPTAPSCHTPPGCCSKQWRSRERP